MLNFHKTMQLISALESGQYNQLRGQVSHPDAPNTYCFYGLAGHIFQCGNDDFDYLIDNVHANLCLNRKITLWEYNDGSAGATGGPKIKPHSFKEIAQLLRVRLRAEQEFLVPKLDEQAEIAPKELCNV